LLLIAEQTAELCFLFDLN